MFSKFTGYNVANILMPMIFRDDTMYTCGRVESGPLVKFDRKSDTHKLAHYYSSLDKSFSIVV